MSSAFVTGKCVSFSYRKANINLILYRSSPYRAVNTLRLRYKNQSVNAV